VRIWVDADACPRPIKAILFRAAERRRIHVTLVADRPLSVPASTWIGTLRVARGADQADLDIVERVRPGDLVVTADIPLAAAVVRRGALALDPRGEVFSEDNVHERLAVRDLLDHLRGTGVEVGGPTALGASDRKAFGDALDRILTREAGRGEGSDPSREV
jgi:hypothetical protein